MAGLECRWPGCSAAIKPQQWACKPHMARIPEGLREELRKAFDWQAIVINGQEPDHYYVAVAEAIREYATGYNERWNIFEGYDGGSGVTAVEIDQPPPRRRRRRRA